MKRFLEITTITIVSIGYIAILQSCKKITIPEVTTKTATNIDQTTATSGGNVVNNGGAEVTARGVCWGTVKNPTVSSTKTSNGKGNGPFDSKITGLIAGTDYFVRAYATNSEGTGYGNEVSFSTLCQAPSANTDAASNISTTAATLNGTVDPKGSSTIITFEYGTTTSYGTSVTAKQSPLTGTGNTSVSADLTGLAPNTVYHYKVKAENCGGSGPGSDQTFKTTCTQPSAPVVDAITQPTCTVTTGSVALSGLPASGTWTLTRTPGGTTTTGTGASSTVSGLPAGTTYTFTVTNASGCVSPSSGNVAIGAQPTLPSATTDAATSVSSTTATLNGTVNANGASTTVTFLYGKTDTYGTTVTATQSPVTGSSNTTVSAVITGLTPNTDYHYQVKAENCAGTNSGSDQQFTTTSGCADAFETNNTIATANTTAFSTLSTGNYTNTITGTIDISSDVDYYRLNITTPGIITITSYSPGADRDITLYDANGVTIDYSVHGYRELIIYPITTTGYYYIKVWGGVNSCLTYTLGINWGPGANTGTFTDYRDGQEYKWVYIGTQFWMAENLNIGTRVPGSQDQTENGVIEKYCYNDNESNCSTYGGLYQWDEMMQYSTNERSHGVCPEGWHVPSDDEWKTLEMTLGMSQTTANLTGWRGSDEGGKLKAVSNLWSGGNVGATNSSDFTALPSGDRVSDGSFEALGSFTDFWTSTINTDTQSIWYRLLDTDHATIYRTQGYRKYGTPLRCVKD